MRASLLPLVPPPGLLAVPPRMLRAAQLSRWLLAGRATSFGQMTDLPLGLRAGKEVTVDGNLVCARTDHNNPAWMRQYVKLTGKAGR